MTREREKRGDWAEKGQERCQCKVAPKGAGKKILEALFHIQNLTSKVCRNRVQLVIGGARDIR